MATRRAVTATAPGLLRQTAIRRIADLMAQVAQLDDQRKNLGKILADEEKTALAILKGGGLVEPGVLQAAIAVTKGQVRPKWAELFEARLGADAAEQARAETSPGPDREELVISGPGFQL